MTASARAARGLAFLAAAALLGCGDEPPAWIDLSLAAPAAEPLAGEVAPGVRAEAGPGGETWLVTALAREAWRADAASGRFRAALPLLAAGHPRDGGAPYRLVVDGRALEYEPDAAALGGEPGRFATSVSQGVSLLLALDPGAEPPARAELAACVAVEASAAGRLRVRGRRLSGAGFFVPSGRARALDVELPADSRLSFATAVEPLLGAREARIAPRTFRVRLDGALLLEHRSELDLVGESLAWHSVELPRGGVRRARLSFEVEGPLALSSILAPTVGPRDVGTYSARPYDDPRPDLVVFLADTFRADNLTAYGGTLGVAPEIDRFAAGARVFARAWSTSTHTLPAHSSMFSGVYPHQNGQVDYHNPLPAAVETLAERLTASGYRCALLSDGVMVSAAHGLDQGFAVCDERREAGTVERARAFLAADDGRPVFLFAQTYAAHTPYSPSAETRARLGERLLLDRTFDEVMASDLLSSDELLPLGHEGPPAGETEKELARRLHDLYRAGVADLDATFGRFRGELERLGVVPGGYFLFTSDHGESFFEHGRPFHTNRVYEVELAVPLVLAGPGVAAGREERPVSLIDLAPTLLSLAGLAPPPHWGGSSLLAPPDSRPLYAFQSRRAHAGSTLAVIEGTRKLIGYEDPEALRAGRLHAAFDLAEDPREEVDLKARAEWPAELAERHRETLERLLEPLVAPEEARRSAEEIEALRRLGYGE